jgi:hypothetical protein
MATKSLVHPFKTNNNTNMKRNIIISLLSVIFITISCSKSSDSGGGSGGGGGSTTCSGVTNNKFAADVNPIIQASCSLNSGCHGAGSSNGPGELLTYNQIFNARVSIKNSVVSGTMPKSGSLSTAQKNSIICWVDAGGLNN